MFLQIRNLTVTVCDNNKTDLGYRIILQQKFLPASHEELLAAFRALDTENTGHLDKEKLTQLFTEEGEAFSQEEMTEFCSAALDPLTKSVHYKARILREDI